jgi:4-hydroxymandelate oxidase
VLVGRPVLWALCVGGAGRVRQMLREMTAELDRAMALAGAKRAADLTPDQVFVR